MGDYSLFSQLGLRALEDRAAQLASCRRRSQAEKYFGAFLVPRTQLVAVLTIAYNSQQRQP